MLALFLERRWEIMHPLQWHYPLLHINVGYHSLQVVELNYDTPFSVILTPVIFKVTHPLSYHNPSSTHFLTTTSHSPLINITSLPPSNHTLSLTHHAIINIPSLFPHPPGPSFDTTRGPPSDHKEVNEGALDHDSRGRLPTKRARQSNN